MKATSEIIFREQTEGIIAERSRRQGEFMVSRHIHKSYEIYILTEGERYYFIDRKSYLVTKGDVVLVSPDVIHKTSATGTLPHERILFQLDAVWLDSLLDNIGVESLRSFLNEDGLVLSLTSAQQAELNDLTERIFHLMKNREHLFANALRLYLGSLVLLIMRSRGSETLYRDNTEHLSWKHQKVQEIADHLQRHPEDRESLQELASRFYISKTYLCRIFRDVTSFTISEYRNAVRIKKAQDLLVHSDYSITEISDLLGYENVTYFERVFKKFSGKAPLSYRKNS